MLYPNTPQLQRMRETLKTLHFDLSPILRSCNELTYNLSNQRFQTLRFLMTQRSLTLKQIIAYESKLRREGRTHEERIETLTNLYPCMDCGDPVYVKPDPSIAGKGGVNLYALCGDCKTFIGRLIKKVKVYFKSVSS